jgi:hypothetical protein
MRLNTGGTRLDAVGVHFPRPSLSHLAATGIAGAEKQDFDFFHVSNAPFA